MSCTTVLHHILRCINITNYIPFIRSHLYVNHQLLLSFQLACENKKVDNLNSNWQIESVSLLHATSFENLTILICPNFTNIRGIFIQYI